MNDFQWALSQMKAGYAVRRSGWNGKGMFIMFDQWYGAVAVKDPREGAGASFPNHAYPVQPFIGMFTASGAYQPGWLASQADMHSVDWEIEPGIEPRQ
jgi:hypothetical protein